MSEKLTVYLSNTFAFSGKIFSIMVGLVGGFSLNFLIVDYSKLGCFGLKEV